MVENFIEEVVTELYKLRGYSVMKNVWYFLEKGEHRKYPGQSDIDVLAIGRDDVHFVSCTSEVPADIEPTTIHFQEARQNLPRLYPVLDRYDKSQWRDVVVAEYVSGPVRRKLEGRGIAAQTLEEALRDFVQLVQARWAEGVKLENPVARTIGYLYDHNLLSSKLSKTDHAS